MQDLYKQYKKLLFKLAYQLTGSVSDAEDAVQDVFVKVHSVPPERLDEPKAYLCKMVTNRCKDMMKAARKKREHYFGEWLPEPFLTLKDDSMEAFERDDLLSYGMLVLLEKLTTSERVVFVLREALGFDYNEIAKLMDKSEVSCRKLFSRASAKMGRISDEPILIHTESQEWVQGFLGALKKGNMNQLLSLLDQDVVLVADGGGKVPATVNPVASRERVARFLLSGLRKAALIGEELVFEMGQVNGEPAILLRSENSAVHTVVLFHIEAGNIHNLYIVRNPDKLGHFV
ncbi:sigma-70 family RNA polymerase sigma factor [Brevibacillus fluminis]|uniref:Sigma-70 family RNA polymerase sigma factor n=1 Tax=Brevibacillus fluminis TaxID=511487 RepID=A0A3M8DI10_9BACL|nr:RNA polymerase sigma factor SigJ [Brevibacillus fluminis]RNB87239.1 sigma-70 family RNA polymerase sigma factor [Brevibacillus fluminis]